MSRGPTGRMVGTAGRKGEVDLCAMATAKTVVWPKTHWNTLGRLHGRNALKSRVFDRCDAARQFFANYELNVFTEEHMDDLHGTGPRPALDLVRTNLSQNIRFKIWTLNEVGMVYERLERERLLHNDRTEIVPNPDYLRVVLHSMGLTNCKPAPTPSVAGSVTQKPDDDADLDME